MANTVFLKLKDQSSVFHDPTSGVTIAGSEVGEFPETPRVVTAYRGGHVDKVTEEDYKAWLKTPAGQKKAEEIAKARAAKAAQPQAAEVTEADEDEDTDQDTSGDQGGRKRKK